MDKDYLIVEDSTERLKLIARYFDNFIGKTFDVAFTSKAAINYLKTNSYYCIFLDHDLEEEHYEKENSYEGTGQEVCRFLVDNSIPVSKIVIHSLNPIGSHNMMGILAEGDYDYISKPFFWDGRYGNKLRKITGYEE